MLQTPNEPTLQLEGIDQQDFKKLQLVKGTFPFQIGLQQRLPGKTLQRVMDGPVGSIYVFYLVFGRHYTLIDFGTGIEIEEVVVPPIEPPGLPPTDTLEWIDDFEGYPSPLLSRVWGAGIWPFAVGICESIITAYVDPFLVYATIPNPPEVEDHPIVVPVVGDPTTGTVDPTSAEAMYPPGYVDAVLQVNEGNQNNGCTGQGAPLVSNTGSVALRAFPGSTPIQVLIATDITIGTRVLFHGYNFGRIPNPYFGLTEGSCNIFFPGLNPPLPDAPDFSIYVSDGSLSQDS